MKQKRMQIGIVEEKTLREAAVGDVERAGRLG